eukprot:TRINITY_DN10115_c0_g1_i1.p1 TRINITY_DN10115_c0_g1~~TRINITY_DN10115_c0_g1_i1.p1  ORF type:complete len:559 (+),score=102.86 TRINITY_DN10115_c0_g1_i1:57-1733(+)
MEGYSNVECRSPKKDDVVVFVVRGTSLVAQVPRRCLTPAMSPVLEAMVTQWEDAEDTADVEADPSQPAVERTSSASPTRLRKAFAPGERDSEGRYVLDGPVNPHAFAVLFEAITREACRVERPPSRSSVASSAPAAGAATSSAAVCARSPSPRAAVRSDVSGTEDSGTAAAAPAASTTPDVEARLEACKFADYYLLPALVRMRLTRELLSNFTRPPAPMAEVMDAAQLGLCRSDMVLDRVYLEGLNLRGLHIENSHIRKLVISNCQLEDCELAMCVTANEVRITRSRLKAVCLGVFAPMVSVEDSSTLVNCNIRVVEELLVTDCSLKDCTFKGSDEDRKERQPLSAVFRHSEIHGEATLPFERLICEQTSFHGSTMKMTKAGASVSFVRARLHLLPSTEGECRMSLCLENCDVMKALTFRRMRLHLRGVNFAYPCEMADVEFPDKVCDIAFPRTSSFRQVRFRQGLQACIATGCTFEGCNLGYGQDAVSDCLLTHCCFQACRFPFLEADSPVANFSGSNFVGCQIQWSGQFPHEENFVINSCWLRKWNLAGCSVSEGH